MIRACIKLNSHIARKPLRVVLAVATILAATAVCVGADQRVSATPPGVNGRISFMRFDADGHWQIWTANPDLTASHQITDGDYDSGWAVWSPDGTRLAFDSTRDDSNHTGAISDIFVMNADGTDVTKLTTFGELVRDANMVADRRPDRVQSATVPTPSEQGIYVVRPTALACAV